MKDKNEFDPEEMIKFAGALAALLGVVAAMPAVGCGYYFWQRPEVVRRWGVRRVVVLGTGLLLITAAGWFLWFDPFPLYRLDWLATPVAGRLKWLGPARGLWLGWVGGTGAVLVASPLFLLARKERTIVRSKDFRSVARRFPGIKEAFADPLRVPIGIDLRDGQIITLDQLRRTAHVLTLGATRQGKTTLMVGMILHAIRHGQPCIIVDPKAEDSTLEMVRRLGRALDPTFDERFLVFSMSKPEKSASYNPLKHGNANQLKDRILEALNWSEQYYQSVAGSFLTILISCTEHLKIRLTLDFVAKATIRAEVRAEIQKRLVERAKAGDARAGELMEVFSALMKKMKPEDLVGLQAQLSILNNPTIGHLMSFKTATREIDLREALAKNQIIYFQLDTLGNADTARRLGRMLLEDLKGLTSFVYNTTPDESQRKFLPVFIDEFGAFASREFIELLKQAGGAKIALHLFSQGLEDLDVVSKEFGRQSSANQATKIILRLDDRTTVEAVCSMAGTVDVEEASYQVRGSLFPTRTGMSNVRETKQMRVEHDAIKNLGVGQAVLIEKSPTRVVAIQILQPDL